MVVAVGESLVGPVVSFFEEVVVAAGGGEVPLGGRSPVGPAFDMVEVAVDCGHATAGEDTGLVAGFDAAA